MHEPRPHRPTDRRREPTAQIEATIDALLLLQAHLAAGDGAEVAPLGVPPRVPGGDVP